MMRRPLWLGAGMVLGAAGTVWAEHRVRRRLQAARRRLTPEHLAAGAAGSVRQAGDRVMGAVQAGRAERARREGELWDDLEATGRGAAPPTGHRAPPDGGAQGDAWTSGGRAQGGRRARR